SASVINSAPYYPTEQYLYGYVCHVYHLVCPPLRQRQHAAPLFPSTTLFRSGGDAGSRIQAEAHRRGHDVTPASRRPRVSSWMRIDAADPDRVEAARSEERRVGKECRSGWEP